MALCALLAAFLPSPAEARRTALIIANASYQHAKPLANPLNDADLVAEAATKAGFEVIVATDLDRTTFDQALREFRARADDAEVALIYYAGHGIESGGTNWLLPVDAKLSEIRDLRFEAVELNALLETLGDARRRIVILDACRDNPFGSNWSIGARSTQRGLSQTPIEGALIIYAASQGQVAIDGTGSNSPFATAVAQRLAEPGLIVQLVGPKITDDVLAATKGRQRPWTYSGMGGEQFYLVPSRSAVADATKAGEGAEENYNYQADSYAWRTADKANTAQDYADYLAKFPSGVFAQTASERLAKFRAADTSKLAMAPPRQTKSERAPRSKPKAASQSSFDDAFEGVAPVETVRSTTATIAAPPATRSVASGPMTVAVATLSANRTVDLAPLPIMPATPVFSKAGYPNCREDYQRMVTAYDRASAITDCLQKLGDYSLNVLNAHRAAMAAHQAQISQLYTDQVGGQDKFTDASQRQFYQAMMKEFADSAPEGAHLADYREAEARYRADRAYLDDRYCFATGSCGGYPVPAGLAPIAAPEGK